ncbi:hypothetical protein Cgig2_021864 [Carnegiea gigantea]|uniref:Endonuclease/exonuclease/phosphatase domain-containing protein n=1 Tax=Carnegiea gigantea TaxID=171969 RepID=A0A9Q1GQ23_9CARY|nr:hypothetical protein Cgig2_021864 [Carnegiea gigantea]
MKRYVKRKWGRGKKGYPPMGSLLTWNIRGLNSPNKQEDIKIIAQRQQLWHSMRSIAGSIQEAWCIMGDFNAVLHPQERLEGEEVQHREVVDFAKCLDDCDIQETNKTVWLKIDRVLVNSYWYNGIRYTHVQSLAAHLSDHAPLKITFPACPRMKSNFMFCEMCCKDPSYRDLIKQHTQQRLQGSKMLQICEVLKKLRKPLRQLNKDKFGDIHEQQQEARRKMKMVQEQL